MEEPFAMTGDEDCGSAVFALVGGEFLFLFGGGDDHVPLGLTVPYWNLDNWCVGDLDFGVVCVYVYRVM